MPSQDNLLLTLEQFWNGSTTVFLPPLNDSLFWNCFCLILKFHDFYNQESLCSCPSPYDSLHRLIQTKLPSCFFFCFLLKYVVHPKIKIIIIYSISCHSKHARLLFIFETQVAVLDAQERTSLLRTSSKHV